MRKKEEASTTARVTGRLRTGVARPNPRALRSVLGTKVIRHFAYHSASAASVPSISRAMTQSVAPVASSLGSGSETRGHLWEDALLERQMASCILPKKPHKELCVTCSSALELRLGRRHQSKARGGKMAAFTWA